MFHLTKSQMMELFQISRQLDAIHKEVYANVPHSFDPAVEKYHRELIEFKIRLEELCDETDDKDEKFYVIENLLLVENFLTRAISDDYGRYTQIALHIDPNHPVFLSRNQATGLFTFQVFVNMTLIKSIFT